MTESNSKPLGEQERPRVADSGPNARGVREILLSGFESRAMHKAYEAWIDSGEAHEDFRNWALAKGLT